MGRAHPPAGADSSASSTVGPLYQGAASERSTTLSPWSAETGITEVEATPSRRESSPISRSTRVKASWSQSTRSILLAQTTNWSTPSSAAMQAWRRVCSFSPEVASTTTRARSAVEAPVAMFRVYCTWPGQSAITNLRLGVAA